MQKTDYPHLGETLYAKQLPNGLGVYVLPKKGFNKTYALLATKYGSIDNDFGQTKAERQQVVDGIAHFLEHKLFEQSSGHDVFSQFSNYGASVNAYTSYTHTAYLFSCTSNLPQNLLFLLDFVQAPYFTNENVAKEKGIITQELQMYADDPDWRLRLNFLQALFKVAPLRIDIGGTPESILKITKEALYHCYQTFYHPSNMALCIVGALDPHEIINLVAANQAEKKFAPIKPIYRYLPQEPDQLNKIYHEQKMPVGVPKILFGFKERAKNLKQINKKLQFELLTELVLEITFGLGSTWFQDLYQAGLIDNSFGYEYSLFNNYAFSTMGGSSPDPAKVIKIIKEWLPSYITQGLKQADFDRIKRKELGFWLSALDSPEFIAKQFLNYKFNGDDFFEIIPLLNSLTLAEANERLRQHFDQEQLCFSVIKPLDN
ncbi:MAG: hypothetical protein RLZ12_606 [Bacillota bacterium]|jgi:predicted Zn-dependent peptidase